MIRALMMAFGQIGDPAFLRVILLCILISLLVFTGLVTAASWLLLQLSLTEIGWLDLVIDLLGSVGAVFIAWLLLPGLMAALCGMMTDPVVRSAEIRHYSWLPPPRAVPLLQGLWEGLRFAGLILTVNLLALPLYLVPVVNLVLFYLVNGYLLGRELFGQIAARRLEPLQARGLARARSGTILAAGLVLAFLSTLPLLNLVMPVIGAVFMLHIFEGMRPPGMRQSVSSPSSASISASDRPK
jgi:CysZ protein